MFAVGKKLGRTTNKKHQTTILERWFSGRAIAFAVLWVHFNFWLAFRFSARKVRVSMKKTTKNWVCECFQWAVVWLVVTLEFLGLWRRWFTPNIGDNAPMEVYSVSFAFFFYNVQWVPLPRQTTNDTADCPCEFSIPMDMMIPCKCHTIHRMSHFHV